MRLWQLVCRIMTGMDQAFTHEEAEEIREDFEDLMDTEFLYNGDMVLVDDIAITPVMDQADGNGYDVNIIASGAPPANEQYSISIREYISLKGVSYNFPS